MKFITKKGIKAAVAVLFFVAAVLCAVRIYYVNRQLPAPAIHTGKAGEWFEYDGALYTVRDYQVFRNEEELAAEFPEIAESRVIAGASFSYLCVKLDIKNETGDMLSPPFIYVNSKQYSNGGMLYDAETFEMGTELPPKETASYIIAFLLPDSFFDDFSVKDTRLLLSCYPVQTELALE